MDDSSPALEVGFVIDTGGSFGELLQLQTAMDSTEAKVLADATRIERATKGMVDVSAATSNIVAFGNATTREMAASRQAMAQVEKAGEALVRSLDREAAAYGKTREQLREARVAELALAATKQGNTDLSARLVAAEAALYDKRFAATRKARAETEALAQAQDLAASQAVATAERQAQALRSAAFAHDLFESAARRGIAAMREMEAAEKVAAATAEATRIREAAHAYDLFETAARKGAAAQREFDAAQAAGARDDEAQRLRSAAFAHDQFEAAARRGAEALRAEETAAASDAAALARLRALIDPAAASQNRLNAELAEARRVMTAAGASAAELGRAEAALTERSNSAAQQHDQLAGSARRSGGALKNIAVQLPDITQGLLTGQKPFQVFIQQGAQIFQVAQMSEGGLRGFGKEVGVLALRFAPLLVGFAAVGAGFALFNRWVNEGVKSDQLTRDLGKITGGANATKQELFKLKDETVTWADTSKALFSVVGKDISDYFVGDMKGMSRGVKGVLDDLTGYMRQAMAGIYAGVAGTKAYLGEIEKGGVVGLGKMLIGQGDPKLLEKTYGAAYTAADQYLTKLGKRVKLAAIDNARERIAKSIGYNNIPKPKVDKHAEQLVRDAEATEAQIRNLYKLAAAYGVSGAAALIAEARVKAESKAIKQQADIEAAVNRQIRLEIAQRVSDSAKSAASMRDQARVQTEVNTLIAAGNVPAERAAELVQDRIADLPLLAAIEVAQQRGLKEEADKATAALKAQQDARGAVKAAEIGTFYAGADQQADRQLTMQREELRLVGATDTARAQAMAKLQAEQTLQAKGYELGTAYANTYIGKQVEIAVGAETNRQAQDAWNASLSATADLFDTIDQTAQRAAQGMADAFGDVGSAIGDALTVMTGYYADQAKLQQEHDAAIRQANGDQTRINRENRLFALRSSSQQIGAFGDMATAAKGFFKEGSQGYKTLETAEKAFRLVQFALSVRAIAQDAIETGTKIANSVARIAVGATEAVVNAIKSLPFPLNLAAGAATVAALASIGVSIAGSFGGGGKNTLAPTNSGTGTVLGDTSAKSDSIKNAIDALKEVDTVTNTFAREMAASLKSIDSQIGGVASLVVRSGNIDASSGVTEGFKANAIGSVLSKIPVIGGILGGLFGSKTSVIGSGLYGGAQSVGSILGGGFDASYYSDIEKKKKLFGLTTSTKYSTQYSGADAGLENQFTLILKSFNDAIAAAAGPLGVATGDVQARLNGFIVDIGKIDLKGLTGAEIEEKLSAVFGAAADGMAAAAFPGLEQFQKVGEGVFETLVRVASTIEAVGTSLTLLGTNTQTMGIGVKLALADQFDSVSALTDAAGAYFETFYSKEEQAAAKTAQMNGVFASLGLAMPGTLAAFRQLVEAQDLTTAAGQSTYATLLKLAPAFADLQASMEGAKSAADIASERQDLQRQLLELQGDTAAIRALDLAKLDSSNRALQEQIYAIQDAQAAATAAKALADAWTSVGDSIMDEVKRIRGLTDAAGGNSFASLQGQFNAATSAARGGDQDAAKSLPALSQALLTAAAEQATSRQELARVQAQTAASLEATYGVVTALTKGSSTPSTASDRGIDIVTASQPATVPAPANDDLASEIKSLREEVTLLRTENNSGHAATAGNTKRIDGRLEAVTAPNGGEAISVASAA
ncbi:hypothetical protein C8J42_101943 [Sphingomonas sp. PP-CE-1A-559]|uniref:phage tail length tape measure family protein n=1 Tax=Sphingomonas sp. PP-CE-1A-559 TaxID=2135657 RepID=UPI00105457AB|nr:phage tail length tape measure family protein [Sphingomonas sp. PP-CE-1A-559]TCP94477.1 hypothetical protein C8J42_101943 [Sphingomonas sp. PP-CE-1A-559]